MPTLNWLGDQQAKHTARRVPYRLLETVSQHGDINAHNWLIQGDNLDASKALLLFYAGKVKCISAYGFIRTIAPFLVRERGRCKNHSNLIPRDEVLIVAE